MAEVVWSQPALDDLDSVADYIALDNPLAARELVRRVIEHVGKLGRYPLVGSIAAEFVDERYRQIVEPPCRVLYRVESERVLILHVMRGERILRPGMLERVVVQPGGRRRR